VARLCHKPKTARPTAQCHRRVAADLIKACGAGKHHGKNILFTDAARDELRILRAQSRGQRWIEFPLTSLSNRQTSVKEMPTHEKCSRRDSRPFDFAQAGSRLSADAKRGAQDTGRSLRIKSSGSTRSSGDTENVAGILEAASRPPIPVQSLAPPPAKRKIPTAPNTKNRRRQIKQRNHQHSSKHHATWQHSATPNGNATAELGNDIARYVLTQTIC